eukprot:360817-Chlamydomonas_euryale.AAC.12
MAYKRYSLLAAYQLATMPPGRKQPHHNTTALGERTPPKREYSDTVAPFPTQHSEAPFPECL